MEKDREYLPTDPQGGEPASRLLKPVSSHRAGCLPQARLSFHVGSQRMQEVFRRIRKASQTNAMILILGESGTGKELAARAIHSQSCRSAAPFVPVNAAALSPTILESELFGHEKGAFTGAVSARIGLIESANGGTLFLDEIGDMPLHVQVKLLRVIENMEILRVGSSTSIPVDVRIVAATHKNLELLVSEGKFREDLYFRLTGVVIELPALRERMEDLATLIQEFLAGSAEAQRKGILTVSRNVLDRLRHYGWPGNLRELRKVTEAMVVEDEDGELGLDDIPGHLAKVLNGQDSCLPASILPGEKQRRVLDLLTRHRWNISRAARDLGIHRSTLHEWLKGWGIERHVSDPT